MAYLKGRGKERRVCQLIYCFLSLLKKQLKKSFTAKYRISTALMIEKPVRRPIVPPIADRMSCHLAFSSCNYIFSV